MITLYHCSDTRSFRVLWALEEVGLEYELKTLPFPPRFLVPDFLEINPLGTVPYFVDDQTTMTESVAICHYLAERGGRTELIIHPDHDTFGNYLNCLVFGEATLTTPQAIVLRYRNLERPERRLPQVAEDYTRWFLARLRAVERIVQQQEYCVGHFTMADISVGYALMLAGMLGLDGGFSPALRAYMKRLSSREAFLRAKRVQQISEDVQ
ncbi:glutathione S-transferase family protein [Aminobacter sp. MDW-2]|uniref:glutathione S-transferase family protein n=1 Tax=Aminobacter sp. MDW-2 TaxID=2666139 RepID=UPI0012AFDC78|nr:glutathione S-transferase family protein [Aminobacter sp. MDW-2]MRX37397.1 glutathione S-transferase [Aminobacter sp. MDW-2]QNH37865.1 glutathione S-transferase family protein [Aminobacter sp. MDW-2]